MRFNVLNLINHEIRITKNDTFDMNHEWWIMKNTLIRKKKEKAQEKNGGR